MTRLVDPDVVRQTIREHILNNYLFTDDGAALGNDDSFQEHRHVDSMGMMQLVQFIEAEFGISIVEQDLLPDRLDSVNRLVQLIVDKTTGAVP